ncbi:hypothetical protein GCM10010302_08800 [Streptomyces polychromogenes]|uniref:Uncharacterized protein n=1 Tax=Streptomyces polychromogenes TaxID=67342 RepID=A0ABN0V3M5_9ACTN
MSDSAIIIVELTVPAGDAPARAADVADWLVERRIVRPNDRPDPLWRPSRYVPGPDAAAAVRDPRHDTGPLGDGVDVIGRRQVHGPGGNYTPPACPNCSVSLDPDTHFTLVETWLARTEPHVTCESCATAALLGDWSGPWALHVANLAVRFHNWPPLSEAFILELGDRLGPRLRLIHERI